MAFFMLGFMFIGSYLLLSLFLGVVFLNYKMAAEKAKESYLTED